MLQFNWKTIYNQDGHPVAKRDLMNGSSYLLHKVSRRDAEAQRLGVFCGFTVLRRAFAELCVSIYLRFALCVLMCPYVVYFTQRRKARKDCGFSVFMLYAFERFAFAKAGWVDFTLPFAFFCFFCGEKMRGLFLAETRRRRDWAFFCGFTVCSEAALSQRLCVLTSGLRLMCSYVTLCGLFHARAQSSQRLWVCCVYSLCFLALRFRKGCVG